MKQPVDIIIVNWNSGPLLRQCLQSIAALPATETAASRVILVDNASVDGSADGLEDLPARLTVLRNPDNRGFGAACNQGAAAGRAGMLLFLNPDTRLYPGALAVPLAEMERPERQTIGLIGITLVDLDGRVARCCARFPTPGRLAAQAVGLDRLWPNRFPPHFLTEWDHLMTREVDQPMGAFLLIRRGVFEQLGGFDERFFVYYEDVDLALRARRLGWSSLYLADAQAMHVGGGTTERIRATRLFYHLRSRIQFAFKHFHPAAAAAAAAAIVVLEPVARLGKAVLRRDPAGMGQIAVGYLRLWGYLLALPWRRPRCAATRTISPGMPAE